MVKYLLKDKPYILGLCLTAGAAAGFFLVISRFYFINITGSHAISYLLTALFLMAAAVITLTLFRAQGEKNADTWVAWAFFLLMAAGLMAARGALFYFRSWDYLAYIHRWVEALRPMTVRQGLSVNVSNYNMPYIYFILGISRIDFYSVYLVKFVSIVFDIVLAFFVMKLVGLKTERISLRLGAFIGALAIPTVLLNGAMWGQCDAIYTAFAMGSVYFALAGKSKLAFVFMGLAISFKMQAIFILPVFFIFMVNGKIRFRDVWLLPATFCFMLLPSIIAGMPLSDVFAPYLEQVSYYNRLQLNAVSIWRLVGRVNEDHFIVAGFFLAAAAVTALVYFTYTARDKIKANVHYVYLSYLFAVTVPFLLPKMHDRFLLMADVLSLVLFAFNKKLWFVPVVTIFASYNAYAFYLMHEINLVNPAFTSLALGVTIIIVLLDLIKSLFSARQCHCEALKET